MLGLARGGATAEAAASLRGRANALVLRATQAALTAGKGAGFLRPPPPPPRAPPPRRRSPTWRRPSGKSAPDNPRGRVGPSPSVSHRQKVAYQACLLNARI